MFGRHSDLILKTMMQVYIEYFNFLTDSFFLFCFFVFFSVTAVNSLYVALGYPPLPGWVPIGGDPCLDGWQGIQCVNSNITGLYVRSFFIVDV